MLGGRVSGAMGSDARGDAPAVQQFLDARHGALLRQARVDGDVTKLILEQAQLIGAWQLRQQAQQQRGLAGAEEARQDSDGDSSRRRHGGGGGSGGRAEAESESEAAAGTGQLALEAAWGLGNADGSGAGASE